MHLRKLLNICLILIAIGLLPDVSMATEVQGVSYAVKKTFLREYGYNWDEASDKVQQKFLINFKRQEVRNKIDKERQQKLNEAKQKRAQRQLVLEKRRQLLRIRRQQRAELLQERRRQAERERSKREMERMKKSMKR